MKKIAVASILIIKLQIIAVAQISQIHFGSIDTPLNGLTITWLNSNNQDSIKWGYSTTCLNGKYVAPARDYHSNYLFDYTFPQLLSDTVMYYSMYDSHLNEWTDVNTYYTKNNIHNNHFTFTAMGDSRSYPADWKTISNAVLTSDFTIFMGDLVATGGNTADWDNWFNYGSEFLKNNIVYHTLGNHELNGDINAFNYKNLFRLPKVNNKQELYYSFNYRNALFICLNSSEADDSIQYNWLINTLENNADKKWKFVWFHKPFFTSPSHVGEMDAFLSTWWKAFDDYNIDVIFNGHTHNYQRSVPINRNISKDSAVLSYGDCLNQGRCQIVTSGAGAPARGVGTGWFIENSYSGLHFVNIQVFDKSIKIKTLDQNRSIIDSFSIEKNFNINIDSVPSDICQGDLITLNGSGANTYTWDNGVLNGNPFIATKSNKYTVIGSNKDGCFDSASLYIKVNPTYHYKKTYEICKGDSILWRGRYYRTKGQYFLNYQTTNHCDSVYELCLNVIPISTEAKIFGSNTVFRNQTEIYYTSNNTNLKYTWRVKNGTITNQISNDSIQVKWDSHDWGCISLLCEDSIGCISETIFYKVSINALGYIPAIKNDFAIAISYPLRNYLLIDYNRECTCEILNIAGKPVIVSTKKEIDLSYLNAGIYFIRIKDYKNELIKIEKFIIK